MIARITLDDGDGPRSVSIPIACLIESSKWAIALTAAGAMLTFVVGSKLQQIVAEPEMDFWSASVRLLSGRGFHWSLFQTGVVSALALVGALPILRRVQQFKDGV